MITGDELMRALYETRRAMDSAIEAAEPVTRNKAMEFFEAGATGFGGLTFYRDNTPVSLIWHNGKWFRYEIREGK